jgi:hypothetical protein
MEALQEKFDETTDPEELKLLSQQFVALKCQQAALRESGGAHKSKLPRGPRLAPTRQEAIEARFEEWIEDEVGRALSDWKVMTEIFKAITEKEHRLVPKVAEAARVRSDARAQGWISDGGTQH